MAFKQRKQNPEKTKRRGFLAALFSHADDETDLFDEDMTDAGYDDGYDEAYDPEEYSGEDDEFLYDEYGNPLYDEYGNPLYDEDGNPLYDEDGNPLYDEDGNPLYDEYGNPLYDEDGNPLYDEYGNPLYDEEGNPLYGEADDFSDEDETLGDFDAEDELLYDEDGSPLYDEDGNPLYDEYGNPLYDEEGNPLYDEYGNPLYDEEGNPLYDEYGNPLYDEEGNPLYDEYGNPLYDEEGNPLYDEYGNPLYDEYGNPLYDEYGNPLYDTTELYDENGDPIADGAEYDAEPLFTPEYDDDDYTLYETGEDEAAPEAEPRTNHKGTRIYGHIPTGSDEEDPYAAPEDGFDLGDDDAPEFENEVEESGSSIPEPETIRLFGTDADAETAQRFRKGSSSNVRVQLNETEMSRAVEAAHRKTKENRDRKQAEKERVRSKRRETIEAFIRRSAANFVFGLAIFIALLAAGYFMFLITDIRITGTTRTYTDDEIRGLTGISKRQHILLVDLEEVREHITANPYMQVNKIEYVFPARIRIDLTERTEAAAIVGLDYNVIIDENGYVLSMTSAGSGGLVQITGVSMSGFKLGQRIGESSDFTTASLISIIAKLKEYNLTDKIRSVDMTTPLAIVMYTRNGFKIHVGQPTDLDSKFTTLSQALPRAEAAHCYTGTLYLSAKGGAVYSPPGAEESALQNATQDANAIRLGSGYEYGMYTAPDAQGNIVPQQSYSTSNGAQGGVPQSTAPAVPDTPDDFQG